MLLELIKSTSSVNGGFINKLQSKTSMATVFGNKDSQITYYMKTKDQVPVGTKGDLPLEMFNTIDRPYTIDDPSSENHGDTIMCKWLELKSQDQIAKEAEAARVAALAVQPVNAVQAQVLPVAQPVVAAPVN